MNREHLQLCASAEWAALVRDELLPWVLEDSDLGADVLEIGAGPGLVTDLLLRLEHAGDTTLWAAGVAGATTLRSLVSDLTIRYYF